MKIALYSRQRGEEEQQFVNQVIDYLQTQGIDLLIHGYCHPAGSSHALFHSHEELAHAGPIDFMISIGGDGSFIDAANLVGDLGIPMAGINTGRIGFLSDIRKENYKECFQMLLSQEFAIENRTLLHVDSSEPLDLTSASALNDVSIRTTDTDSISAVTVWADGQKINTYWADGLIIATPTGSTAYSMSCGGPILHPQAQVMVLTPIAPHSLNVRPLVIPASTPLTIEVNDRMGKYALCLDSQRILVEDHIRLHIQQEKYFIRTISFSNSSFYNVIREKLLWGIDKRNFR